MRSSPGTRPRIASKPSLIRRIASSRALPVTLSFSFQNTMCFTMDVSYSASSPGFRGFRRCNGFRGRVQEVQESANILGGHRGGMSAATRRCMAGARSHEELVVWKLAHELKLKVYAL